MEKKVAYSKPLMAMERFTPQEYVAECTQWVVVIPTNSDLRKYSRIDFNGNGVFDITYNSYGNTDYTERGFDYFGNDAANTVLGGRNEVVNVNVYKIDSSKSNITPDSENGARYDNGDYTLSAIKLLKHTYGSNVKYYAIDYNGQTYTEKNAS